MILAVRPALAASPNGAGGLMAAYYDGQLFTINFKQEPAGAEQAFQAHNGSINNIYMSDAGLPGGEMFVSVLDAIQGDGLNPLWVEQQIAFNAGLSTGEVYRSSVVGAKVSTHM